MGGSRNSGAAGERLPHRMGHTPQPPRPGVEAEREAVATTTEEAMQMRVQDECVYTNQK